MSVKHLIQPVDTSRWSRRNVWRLPSGESCVRPGLRNVFSATASRAFVGGFTVEGRDEVWHYLFDMEDEADLILRIVDDNFNVFSSVAIQSRGVPRGLSHAVVEGQILIGSPDIPTMWGRVDAATVVLATKQDSVSGQSTINVPRGVVTRWSNRAVIASGPSLFITDPVAATGGDLRSIISANQNNRPSNVYGAHEAAGGMLVVVTASGVWGLDVSAAAVGIVGSNGSDWRVLSHHDAISYDSSCTVRGRLFLLTRRGWTLADVPTHDEQTLDDDVQSRALSVRATARDYRACRMYASDDGPIVANDAQALIHRYDIARPISTWWDGGPSSGKLRGVLRSANGLPLFVFDDMICAVDGNCDADSPTTLPASPEYPTAVVAGLVPTPPEAIDVVRHVHSSASLTGEDSATCSVNGAAPSSLNADALSDGVTLGTTLWGADGARYRDTPLASFRFDADDESESGVEVSFDGGMSRVDDAVTVHVIRKDRPSNANDVGPQ